MVEVRFVAGSVISTGFGWEYRRASITVSTMAGNFGSPAVPRVAGEPGDVHVELVQQPLGPRRRARPGVAGDGAAEFGGTVLRAIADGQM